MNEGINEKEQECVKISSKLLSQKQKGTENIYLTYSPPEIKHIRYLWNKYGLSESLDDDEISETVSKWISILYPNQYHIKQKEIISMFNNEEAEQGRIYSEYREKGLRINLINWRHVVLDNIFDSLPSYK